MKMAKALGWVLAIVGVWELAAPFVLGYAATDAAIQDIIIGVTWITFGLWIALTNKGEAVKWLGWLGFVVGIWLFFAPAVLGYTSLTASFWNDLLVGFVGAVVSMWAAFNAPKDAPAAPQPEHH